MAHFNPLDWTIEIPEHDADSLHEDPIAQSRFVHEYVHYCQFLTGTVGRSILADMAILSIKAGLHHHYGGEVPRHFEQIDLWTELESAERADFEESQVKADFQEVILNLTADLHAVPERVNDANIRPNQFVKRRLEIEGGYKEEYPHLAVEHGGSFYAVPLTDRVLFENMARQVQRNFLQFVNNLDVTHVDRLRGQVGEVSYTCLHDYLANVLGRGEDAEKWTITLCQLSIMCENPGLTFEHIVSKLARMIPVDLPDFMRALDRDSWFLREYNNPGAQEIANLLITRYGTAIRPSENYELREFVKNITNAINAVSTDRYLYATTLLDWRTVGQWVANTGCPPMAFSDRDMDVSFGIPTNQFWHKYLQRANELLGAI